MTGIIDRFEGIFAVIVTDDDDIVNVQRDRIPAEAVEGDYINMDGNVITIDYKETARRKKNSKKNLDLWED